MAAADAPASPVPTTITLKRRLLDAFTSRTVKRWLSHARWIEPGGIRDSSVRGLN